MVIGVDLDGVVADFNTAYIELVPKLTGRNLFPAGYTKDDITTWSYPETFGYTNKEISAVWKWIGQDDEFWFNLKPLEGAEDFLEKLAYEEMAAPHDIYFITSRVGYDVKRQSEEWLVQHGWGGGFAPTVLISYEKGLCCKALKINAYIDDKNENCEQVLSESPKTLCYMLARPWNSLEAVTCAGNIIRADNLVEFMEGLWHGK